MLCTGPPQYPHVCALPHLALPLPFGLAPDMAFTGSVLMVFWRAASMCEALAFDNSLDLPSDSMSARGYPGSSSMRSLNLLEAQPCIN